MRIELPPETVLRASNSINELLGQLAIKKAGIASKSRERETSAARALAAELNQVYQSYVAKLLEERKP